MLHFGHFGHGYINFSKVMALDTFVSIQVRTAHSKLNLTLYQMTNF